MNALIATAGAILLTINLHVPGWGVAGAALLAWALSPYDRR